MEVVRIFNNELSSLYEVKPPISKAKMTQITKSAIKGIKFYKHVVQSVEKFIQKCRPEYKVPGLYVVDSIVRQSRHQFGSDKDVFGPRFVKNITLTFQHLFRCAEDDRPKIIRVLNLWQKNAVFPIEVIQPLLDMGHPNTSTESYSANDEAQVSRHKVADSTSWKGWNQNNEESTQENRQYAEMSTKNLEKFTKAEMANSIDDEVSRSSYRNQSKLEKPPEETVKFNKKLLDFDYGDEEDEEEAKNDDSHLSNQPNALALSMAQNLLSNPELLRQLQQMQQTIQQTEALKSELALQPQHTTKSGDTDANYVDSHHSPKPPVVPPMPYTEASMMPYQFDKNNIPYPAPQPPLPMMEPMVLDSAYPSMVSSDQHLLPNTQGDEDERVMYSMPGEPPLPPQDFDERTLMVPVEERGRKERSRSRSGSRSRRSGRHRSRSRSPRRKRSRSRSHSRKNRSRSRERERIREKERERERERERRRKGIPPVKKGCVSVCSTTLWLGHVPKSCSEVDISNTFGPYGTILSIDMIPPRGCAYVVMDRRQDGYKALQKLKNLKLQGSSIKMAWAPGKGVKGKEYKDYWEVELGVSYVPYEKIPEDADALDLLEEGGFIDEESLPEHLRALRKQPDDEKSFAANNKTGPEMSAFNEIQAPPNMVPPPIMPPTSVSLPMVMPHLIQPQYGLHLSGLLPPQAMVIPMGIPPPNPMLMVQQQSQSLLSNQGLSIVGGVPQMVQRTVPPALQNLKNAAHSDPLLSSPMVSVTAAGDATPTEEDGTSVSSPSIVHMSSISGSASTSSMPIASTQPGASMTQFNHAVGLHNTLPTANRPMISVPPPVSAAGAPIPYPPPNVGFNFPPPGIRPPVQAPNVAPNPQFQWMQKSSNSSFNEADSNQSVNSAVSRSIVPQPGMPHHMFGVRPPFHDPSSSISSSVQSPVKDAHATKSRDNSALEISGDMDPLGNRNLSPVHHDKMLQEMVISTDDESSMDHDYSRNDVPMGPRFQGPTEFPRGPMNMQRMRPPGPMQGPRFSPRGMHMGAPFPMRMGGPRGMGGPGMHPRMEMEFPGPRGPRMGGPHGPRRNDNIHPPPDGRDWYPRDFDGPPFERERDRRYHDDWSREAWVTPEELENDTRRIPRDRDDGRRDEPRDPWNRDGPTQPSGSRDRDRNDADRNESSGKQKQRPKPKVSQSVMDDMFKLRFYQRDKKPDISHLNRKFGKKDFGSNWYEQSKEKQSQDHNSNDDRRENEKSKMEVHTDSKPSSGNFSEKELSNDRSQPEIGAAGARKEKDRESRKRSRWGRTLSEEREFQQQKRNEIEMKFQSYEQSHAAQQPLPNVVENVCIESEVVTTTSGVVASESEIMSSSSEIVTPTPELVTLTPDVVTPIPEVVTSTTGVVTPASEIVTAASEIVTATSEIVTAASEMVTSTEIFTKSNDVNDPLVSTNTECDNLSTPNVETVDNAVIEPVVTENYTDNCVSECNENMNNLSTNHETPCDSISEINDITNGNNESTSPLISAES